MARKKRDRDVAIDEEPADLVEPGEADCDEDGTGAGHPAGEPRRRRTLAEAVADSQDAAGLRCPRCGCCHSQVAKTWDVGGARRRRRVCRHCGWEYPTTER